MVCVLHKVFLCLIFGFHTKSTAEAQSDVALYYSRTQLNTQQLNELKSGNNEKAVKVDLCDYSSAHKL